MDMPEPTLHQPEPEQKNKGFSLLEILVAAVILAVSIFGIMAVLPSGYTEVALAGKMSTLNHLAQLKVDQLKSLPYNHSDLYDGQHPTPTFPWRPPYTDSSGNTAFSDYSVTWYVNDDVPRSGVKEVSVEAAFNKYDSSGNLINAADTMNQRAVRIVTYVTQ